MARSKKPSSMGDLVRSLAVILIPLVIITWFFTRSPESPAVLVVDYRPVLAQARQQAPFEVLAPTSVPKDWRATRATWLTTGQPGLAGEPSVRKLWQLGFLTGQDVYVELDQGDLRGEDLIVDRTRKGLPDGQSTVGTQVWQRLISSDERTRSLVLPSAKVTTIVVGDLPYADLESYAATLAPAG
ncbi:DUF4245 domain-containing protein [uncultured Friedmanniella sp.]|uniref:DUF4245 domain-containing protein n=1 Tax=uncultured Friedmanniella sp. TaxID=335381 RepID=UPI0035CAFDB5